MIGRLRGRLDGRGENWVLVDVGGVGYMVEGRRGYWTDARPTVRQCRWQSKLMCAKTSFGCSVFERRRAQLVQAPMVRKGWGQGCAGHSRCVVARRSCAGRGRRDKAMVARAPGVGPKVAQRIVQELKDKIPEAAFGVAVSADAGGPASQAHLDAMSALTNLGYQRAEAHRALQAATAASEGDEGESAETLIRKALKELAK